MNLAALEKLAAIGGVEAPKIDTGLPDCPDCKAPLADRRKLEGGELPEDVKRHHGRGLCYGCYKARQEAGEPLPDSLRTGVSECRNCGCLVVPQSKYMRHISDAMGARRHGGKGLCIQCWNAANGDRRALTRERSKMAAEERLGACSGCQREYGTKAGIGLVRIASITANQCRMCYERQRCNRKGIPPMLTLEQKKEIARRFIPSRRKCGDGVGGTVWVKGNLDELAEEFGRTPDRIKKYALKYGRILAAETQEGNTNADYPAA